MRSLRRGGAFWTAPLLLFLAVLLAAGLAFNLAHLETGGEALPEVPSAGGSEMTPLGLTALAPLFALAVAFTALIVFLGGSEPRWPWRTDPTSGPFFRGLPLRFLVVPAVLFALLVLFGLIAFILPGLFLNPSGPDGALRHPSETTPAIEGPVGSFFEGLSYVAFFLIGIRIRADGRIELAQVPVGPILAMAFLGGLLAFAFAYRGPRDSETERASESAASRGTQAKESAMTIVSSLDAGADVRSAVLRCFDEFCVLLSRHGVPDQQVLTPRELEGLAISRLRVSRDAVEAMTALFEVARYSTHPLDEADRDQAVTSLDEIRASLPAWSGP